MIGLQKDWLWDKKISIGRARGILKNPKNERFLSLSATLLSRKNTPKEVFGYYINPKDFIINWQRIKRVMRQDSWNNPRIEFWQAIYEALKEKYEKKGFSFRKGPIKNQNYTGLIPEVAKKIKEVRKKKGLTQKDLAKRLKVSQQLISKIESGKENISLLTLKNITDSLEAELKFEIT